MKQKTELIMRSGYKIEKFIITKDNIKNFNIMENRRQVSESHVKRIHGALLKGKNPLGVLIINKRDNETRLIDGNHRIEAVKRFYGYKKSYSNIKIECILKVYENLTSEQEREVYSDEARRKNESYEDRITMYKDVLNFWKLFNDRLNPFPCKVTIYSAKNSLKFRNIINALYTIDSTSDKGYTPQYLPKDNLIGYIQELNYEQFKMIKDFVIFFQDAYGKVGDDNIFCRKHFFIPLMDIFHKNRTHVRDSNFKERFLRITGKAELLNYGSIGTREAQIRIRNLMIEYMNYKVTRNLFI